MVDCYHHPLLKTLSTIIVGLMILISIPASADTNCSEKRENEGEAQYLRCKFDEEKKDNEEDLKERRKELEDSRKDMRNYFEELEEQAKDLRDDIDRALRRKEEDAIDRLDDLKDDDANEETIEEQRIELDRIRKSKAVTKNYFNSWIDAIVAQKDMENERFDLEIAEYEYELFGDGEKWIQWK